MADPTVSLTTRDRTSYAQPAVSGTNINIGREETQFAAKIALEQKYIHPVTLMIQKVKREMSRTIDVHWFEDKHVPNRDQINWGTNYTDEDTSFTVDHGEYFAVGDVVRLPKTDECILITAKSGDVISGTRDYGESDLSWTAKAAAINDNDYLEVLGNAFEPGHTLPTYKHTIDVEKKNYCQDFRTPVIITEVSDDTVLRGEQDRPYQISKQGKVHFWKQELQSIWGKPGPGDMGVYDGTNNTRPAVAGGINHYIDEYTDAARKVDQDDLTEWEFLDFLEAAFEKGSRSKLLVCPRNLRTAFDKWGITRQNTFSDTSVLGMKIGRWQTSHGDDLLILTHEMLKQYVSTNYYYAFVVDMAELSWVTFGRNGASRFRKAGSHETHGKTLTEWEFETIGCITVKNPNSHARLRYKTYSA